MDWSLFVADTTASAQLAFLELLSRINGETVFAYCLYTDGGAMTVMPAFNSEEAVADALARRPGASEGFTTACRWSPSEWKYEGAGEEHFTAICESLAREPKGRTISAFKQTLLEKMTEVLINTRLAMKARGMVDVDTITFFVSISDDDSARQIEDTSAKAINPDRVFAQFQNRYA